MMFCLGETAVLGQERAENKLEDVIDQLLLETAYVSGDRQFKEAILQSCRRQYKSGDHQFQVATPVQSGDHQFK